MIMYHKLFSKLGSLLLISCLFFGYGQFLFAQDLQKTCGFDHIHRKVMQENAEYKKIVEANEAAIQKYIQLGKGGRTEGTVYKIPCVVHIIHTGGAIGTSYNPTDATITTMISNMTKAFRNQAPYTSGVGTDVEIEFELAKRSPTCTATTGINRVNGSGLANYVAGGIGTGGAADADVKALSIWSNIDYYNIWIVNKIDGNDGNSGTFTAGYAYFPGASANVDGTVMLASQTGSVTTITHELGHALNLFHTFEGSSGVGVCPPNGTCTVDGDKVCDTAPQDANHFQCATNVCGATTVLPNYMSYSNCATRDYTAGQSTRMRAALTTLRSGLISSQALVAPVGAITASACTPTGSGLSAGRGVTSFTFNTINAVSDHAFGDNANYVDRSCLQQTTVAAGATIAFNVATSVNASNIKIFIDYNNNGDFTDAGEQVFVGLSTLNGAIFDINSNITILAAGITVSTPLRMRVVSGGGTAASLTSCNVNTGQAEDYGITIIPASLVPTITLSAAALTAFSSCAGIVSANQSYTVAGSNLTADIVITRPNANFEISTSAGSGFTNTLTLTQTAGTVGTTTIFVRQTTTAANAASGNITHTSTNATQQDKAIPPSIVNALPTMTGISVANVNTVATSFNLAYTSTAGTPDQYSITTGAVVMAGFATITNAMLGTSPLAISIPASAANTYDFNLTLRNSTTGCVSAVIPFTLTVSAAPTPVITLSAASLTAFSACAGTASATQSYTVAGVNLTADIVITAPTGFEISSTGAAPFSTSLNLTPIIGTVGTTTITVRQTSSATNGANGNITNASNGATTQNKAIPISIVNALPTISGIAAANVNTAATSFSLVYTGTTDSPDQYSILSAGTATPMPSFTPITNASLATSPLTITIPASAANTYTFNLTVRNSTTGCVSAVIPFTLTVTAPVGTILLVNPAGTGSTKLVTVIAADWANKVYPSLQAALDVAISGDQIWVKQGTHLPTKDATGNAAPTDNRTKTFKIPNGISVYGGFLATETLLTARNATTNVTILSGDVGVVATDIDNCYNVVVITNNATDTRLDGFTVEKGHDDRASEQYGQGIYIDASRAIIVNCIVTNNIGVGNATSSYKFGIGIYIGGTPVGATPQVQILNSTISNNIGASGGAGINIGLDGTILIRHCIFKGNIASAQTAEIGTGGAFQIGSSTAIVNLENSLLVNNVGNGTADDGGGAIMMYQGTLNVSNCTIANNSTTGSAGGGIRKSASTNTNLTVNNSIIYGNTSVNSVIANDIQIAPGFGGTFVVNNNLLQCPVPAGATGTGNINNNPRFVSATDFSLQTNSPCLNVGDNTLIPAGVTVDLANNGRTFGTSVDMGAYELQAAAVAAPVPSLSIAASPAGAICAGASITFTATPTNGGTTPAYQWKVNGGNVGTNSTTYTTTTLVNGDVITCEMTPIEICNTYASNGITPIINIIYVRTDGNDANSGFANTPAGAKLTIQAGVNAVNDGCTLVVNAGTYNESINITGKGFRLELSGLAYVRDWTMDNVGKTVAVTISAGNLFINRLLDMKNGTLATANRIIINATSTEQGMIINSGGIITGNMLVNRYLQANTGTSGLGYRFVSSPTSNAIFQQMMELNPIVNPAFNGAAFPGRITPFPTLYSYNPALAGDPAKTFITSPFPEFDKGWVSPNALTDAMTAGRGYTVNTSANQVVGIAGLLNNGNVTIPVSMGNAASLGYNLVGNPYPSPIKWSLVKALSPNVNDAIYQNMATGQYTGSWASYVSGVGVNGATDNIAVMQGFFVIANAAGNLNFANSTRVTTYSNPNSFRTEDDKVTDKNATKNNGLLRLAMTNSANKTDETVIYFTDKATQNFDSQYDAYKFQLNGGNFSNIYTTNDKNLFAINALPNLTDDLVVPIVVQSWNGGVQKIAMTEKLNFTREVQVFLKDNSTNTLHDFSKGTFEFTATSGIIANRFEIVFKPQFTTAELQGDNLNVYPNPSSEVLNISIGDDYKGELTLRLTDVSGREVWTAQAKKISKIYENSVNLSNLASGTYLLEVSGAKKMVKKIVKN